MRDIPCLVLLGAPGMGKSREAEAAFHALRAQGEAADLIAVGRRADPLRSLLDLLQEAHAEAWRMEGAPWHLFIDGIDEAFGAAAGFEAVLRTFLNALGDTGGDLAKMRLRVLCRTVEWTPALDRLLEQFWSEQEIRKLQIAPLSVGDVRRAVDSITGDKTAAERFLARIDKIGAAALASRPVSLVMLAELQREHGELPGKQADLYRLGLETLADEPNEGRRRRMRRGALNAAETLAVAARIAAATAFSGKSSIWIGPGPPPDPDVAFALREIAGGVEPAGLNSFRLAEADLVDAVRTPLFVPIGADSYVWVHQTFMEYLAARYLVDHELSADQMLELLAVADPQGARRTAPQWREIAAWAATLSKPFFDRLMANEPDVLLQSDVAAVDAEDRKRLVDALLVRLDAGELVEIIYGLRPLFSRLDHPGLAHQLRDVVFDPARRDFARRVAIDIAEETHLSALGEDFARLALMPEAPLQVRIDAAYAVSRVGGETAKAMLGPILRDDLIRDENDELRGAALKALWPDHLTLAELLGAITREKRDSLIGGYHMFLRQLELADLSADDALEAVRWLEAQNLHDAREDGLETVQATVFWAAAARSDDARVREAVAAFLAKQLEASSDWLSAISRENALAWPTDAAIRLVIVRQILARSDDPEFTARLLLYNLPGLLTFEDLDVTLAALRAEKEVKVQGALAELITSLIARQPLDDLVAVFDAADASPPLKEALERHFSVTLDSSAARLMRDSAEREKKQRAKLAESEKAADVAGARVQEALAAIDVGDANIWWRLNLQLFVSASGRYENSYEFQSDLTATPGWARLSRAERERVIDGAVRYLTEGDLSGQRWLGANTHYRPAAAAFRAFRLVFDTRRKAFANLADVAWRRWAPAVVGFFDNDFAGVDGEQVAILKEAYRRAPDAVLGAVARMALGPKSQGLSHRALLLLESIYDRRLGALLDRLRRRKAFKSQEVEGGVWGFLVRMRYAPALQELRDALAESDEVGNEGHSNDAVGRAAAERLRAGDVVTWEAVQRIDESRPDLARAIWSSYASSQLVRRDGDGPAVQADLLASVYLDLERLFPDRPEAEGARFLQAIDYIERLQSALLERLVNGGTAESIAAVARLERALPRATWLGHRLQEAKRNYRAAARRLYAPDEVISTIETMSPRRLLRDEMAAAETALALDAAPTPDEAVVPDALSIPTPGTVPEGAAPARRLKILLLASEWRSGHGGISTVNRDLCIALAEAGHDVCCVALEASKEDQMAAEANGVRLLPCPAPPGLFDRARFLALRSHHLDGFRPDAVFGHDHINGAEAFQVSETVGGLFVHVLHTVPQDSEIFKDRVGEGTRDPGHGYEKAQAQRAVARAAGLVVGIGPKISDEASLALGSDVPVHELTPGLSADLLTYTPDPGRLRRFRALLSARMIDAVSKGAQLACEAMKRAAAQHDGARPKLVLRGFTKDQTEAEFEKFADLDDYRLVVELRTYTQDTGELRQDLETSSLVVLPSLSEGFGLSAFEAIAAGIPVLVSFDSGLAELLMRMATDGIVDQEIRDECIVRVHDKQLKLNYDGWATKVAEVVTDPGRALARAERLRAALRPILTWRRAADALTAAILKVLDDQTK